MAKKKKQANPRKAQPGTSYTATGFQPADTSPEEGSSRVPQIIELVPELNSPYARTQTYAKMMNDAGVDVSMRIFKTPVTGAEYFIEPYSDDPTDKEIADFAEANLFGGMSSPFINSIEDIMHMCEDGYSMLYKAYENRPWSPSTSGANTKTYTMLKKLGYRGPSTVKLITYDDNGGAKTISHTAIKGDNTTQDIDIDITKLLIFTLNKKGGDITGKSLLRTAYPHWYYKTHLYKIDAIQKERHSLGVPKGKLLPGYNASDKAILRTLLANLRTNEESFMLLTPNVEVEFAEVHGNLVDVLGSASHHNVMILMNVMAQFMALGMEHGSSGGGRATGATQSDMFMKSLKFIANYVCDVINMYLIPELVVWNYKTTNFPKLAVRNIGETRDLQMFASALANLFAQQALTGDPDTENWIRTVFDMPAKEAAAMVQQPAPVDAGANGTGDKGNIKQPRDKLGANAGKAPSGNN